MGKGYRGSRFLEFVCEKDGTPSHFKITSGISADIDLEAVRVLKLLRWIPAVKNGNTIRSVESIAIYFIISPDLKREDAFKIPESVINRRIYYQPIQQKKAGKL